MLENSSYTLEMFFYLSELLFRFKITFNVCPFQRSRTLSHAGRILTISFLHPELSVINMQNSRSIESFVAQPNEINLFK